MDPQRARRTGTAHANPRKSRRELPLQSRKVTAFHKESGLRRSLIEVAPQAYALVLEPTVVRTGVFSFSSPLLRCGAPAPRRRPTMAKKDPYRIYLSEDQIPTSWYNLRADMATKPGHMLLPDGTPAEVAHISPVFAEELCRQ
jgi:hypothetical protein